MKGLFQDLQFGLRMLWKSPAFTFVSVASLALGIGLNTAIFSLINVILIRPVPVVKAARANFLPRLYRLPRADQ